MIQKIWNWIVWSSSNPEKISLTIKGFATFVPALVVLFAFLHIQVTSDTLLAILNDTAIGLSALATFIGVIMSIYGSYRKISTTALGTNQVLNKYY